MRLWRPILYFYATGSAVMALASFTLSERFAVGLLLFASVAGWAARTMHGRTTIACGVAAFLPTLGMTGLVVPGLEPSLLFRTALVGAVTWCIVCIVVARRLPTD